LDIWTYASSGVASDSNVAGLLDGRSCSSSCVTALLVGLEGRSSMDCAALLVGLELWSYAGAFVVTLLACLEAGSQAGSVCFAATMVFEVVKRGGICARGVEWPVLVDLNDAARSIFFRVSALK